MKKIFETFYRLFSERCAKQTLLSLGEDSVRYDFFYALTIAKKLKPSDILIEYPLNLQSFIARNNQRAFRKEKPQMDLVVENRKLKISAEFGLFRQNSNENGAINSTARTVKFLNDMIRLGVDSFFTGRKSYFICVADDTFLGHQLKTKLIGAFPSHYQITKEIINRQLETKTSKFDQRFLPVFESLNSNINAQLVYDKEVHSSKITRLTKILIWEITLIRH